MAQNIVIIDYHMGNIHSVVRKLSKIGIEALVSHDPELILQADKLLFPGVGHFGEAMRHLKELKLIDALNEAVLIKKTPILGICLGMQLMTKSSEEGNAAGFGWIDAEVKKFSIDNKKLYKVPHVGWNTVSSQKESKLMIGIPDQSEFYFVHSYYCKNNDLESILQLTDYETSFCAAFEKDNIFGVQYHPEKSHHQGAALIKNFIER